MTFVFALQPLLAVRERHEDAGRLELALAARATARMRERRRLAYDAFVRAREAAASAMRSSPAALRDALVRCELFEDAVRRADASLHEYEEHEALARAAFSAARRERRRFEILRDRARDAYEAEIERRETIALEDANAAAHTAVTLFASSFHN